MSGLKPPEVEAKLWQITEDLATIRAQHVIGNLDYDEYKERKDDLEKSYVQMKHETEDAEPDYSEPDYSDYVEEDTE